MRVVSLTFLLAESFEGFSFFFIGGLKLICQLFELSKYGQKLILEDQIGFWRFKNYFWKIQINFWRYKNVLEHLDNVQNLVKINLNVQKVKCFGSNIK